MKTLPKTTTPYIVDAIRQGDYIATMLVRQLIKDGKAKEKDFEYDTVAEAVIKSNINDSRYSRMLLGAAIEGGFNEGVFQFAHSTHNNNILFDFERDILCCYNEKVVDSEALDVEVKMLDYGFNGCLVGKPTDWSAVGFIYFEV